jgi:hypothetical protein
MNQSASALGKLARGKAKTLTAAEIARRRERLETIRYRGGRKKGAKNKVKEPVKPETDADNRQKDA